MSRRCGKCGAGWVFPQREEGGRLVLACDNCKVAEPAYAQGRWLRCTPVRRELSKLPTQARETLSHVPRQAEPTATIAAQMKRSEKATEDDLRLLYVAGWVEYMGTGAAGTLWMTSSRGNKERGM